MKKAAIVLGILYLTTALFGAGQEEKMREYLYRGLGVQAAQYYEGTSYSHSRVLHESKWHLYGGMAYLLAAEKYKNVSNEHYGMVKKAEAAFTKGVNSGIKGDTVYIRNCLYLGAVYGIHLDNFKYAEKLFRHVLELIHSTHKYYPTAAFWLSYTAKTEKEDEYLKQISMLEDERKIFDYRSLEYRDPDIMLLELERRVRLGIYGNARILSKAELEAMREAERKRKEHERKMREEKERAKRLEEEARRKAEEERKRKEEEARRREEELRRKREEEKKRREKIMHEEDKERALESREKGKELEDLSKLNFLNEAEHADIEKILESINTNNNELEMNLQNALFALSQSRYIDAEKYAVKAHALGGDPRTYYVFGRVEQYKKNYEEAKSYYEKSIALKGDYADSRFWFALNYINEDEDYESAVEHFRKAYELDEGNPVYACNLASALAETGEYDEAEKYFEKALEGNSKDADILYNAAVFYEKYKPNSAKSEKYYSDYKEAVDNPHVLAHLND